MAGAEITASAVVPATSNAAKRDILFIVNPFADDRRCLMPLHPGK
jgi:hypothetical protein